MPGATFACPDLSEFCRLDELGLEVTGQRLEPDRAVLACQVTEPDLWCRRCGGQGSPGDSVTRELAHEPLGWRPTTLLSPVRPRCPWAAAEQINSRLVWDGQAGRGVVHPGPPP